MSSAIVIRIDPHEEELAAKCLELSRLQSDLGERELFLANLRAELSMFQGRYLREVGSLYDELDDLRAKFRDWLSTNRMPSSASPDNWDARLKELAGEQSQTSGFSSSDSSGHYNLPSEDAALEKNFTPSTDLKRLYREVAKRVHPDLAVDNADRCKRELLMKRANDAYQRGDYGSLQTILEEYDSIPESVRGNDLAADLARVTRQIEQVSARLLQIEREISNLLSSDICKLKRDADRAAAEGRDLLAEMAVEIKMRINRERARMAVLHHGGLSYGTTSGK